MTLFSLNHNNFKFVLFLCKKSIEAKFIKNRLSTGELVKLSNFQFKLSNKMELHELVPCSIWTFHVLGNEQNSDNIDNVNIEWREHGKKCGIVKKLWLGTKVSNTPTPTLYLLEKGWQLYLLWNNNIKWLNHKYLVRWLKDNIKQLSQIRGPREGPMRPASIRKNEDFSFIQRQAFFFDIYKETQS